MYRDGTGTYAPLLGEALPVELMNTIWADRDGVHDALATPDEALSWLCAIRHRLTLHPASVTDWLHDAPPEDLGNAVKHLRHLRDALRRLAAEATADPRTTAASANPDRQSALAVLEHACESAPTWSTLHWDAGKDPRRELRSTAPPGQTVVAMLAEQAVDLFTGELTPQLRACLAPGCVLYFFKQHPRREWCSAGCGNRARVARHYQRHRREPTG